VIAAVIEDVFRMTAMRGGAGYSHWRCIIAPDVLL